MFKLTLDEIKIVLDWYMSYAKEHPAGADDMELRDKLIEFEQGPKVEQEVISE